MADAMEIAPNEGMHAQKHDNQSVCAGVWAGTAGGRRTGSSFKRENRQYSLGGGGGGIAFIFWPGGQNRTIFPVKIADNMTIKRRTRGFGLKRLGDCVAASFYEGDFCRIFGRGGYYRGRNL